MTARSHINTFLRQFEHEFDVHNQIEVSRQAIAHNLGVFAAISGPGIIPVLKGNAYGHGIEQVVTALRQHPLEYVAVDGYFEALRIRAMSRQPVLVMGKILPQNFTHMKLGGFAFVVDDNVTIEALAATHRPVKIHLEINTGMNRYGAQPHSITELTKIILSHPNIEFEGLMTHLADSDGTDPATVSTAVEVFDEAVEAVRAAGANPKLIHVAQTAGSLKVRSNYANAIRLGIGLYGINPFTPGHPTYDQLHRSLKPALKLTSTITKIIELKAGDRVSYNYTFTAPQAMTIGVLPLGYFEGLNRAVSNSGLVKIGASYASIVGRVCMNHTMINLEAFPQVKVGDPVTIYSNNASDENTIDALSAKHNLFNYNLLTALSPDVRRRLVN